jgi:hypothetical protein
MTRELSSTPPGQPPAGTPASAPAAGGKGGPLRTCHVATSCATRDDLINALAPFVEGNAVFIPGRIPLEPGDVIKLNLSLRDGPIAFSGTFEARAIYREGTGVMGKAGVLFLVRRLDEPSQAVHQHLLRRKRELAGGPRPASLTRTLFGRPAELPTPGPRTPGPQSATPGPVAHTPAPMLVTPQTPKPGSLPAPTVNPFAEMTTNAIDFFVEATLTEDSAGAGTAGADATTETPPPDFLGLPVPGARKTLPLPSPVVAPVASRTPAPVTSGVSATVAAPLPQVSGTANTIASPLPRPLPPIAAGAPRAAPAAPPAAAGAPQATSGVPAAAPATPPPVRPSAAAMPAAVTRPAASPAPAPVSPPPVAASPPPAAASPPPAAAMAVASSAAVTLPAVGAVRTTPGETPPPISLSSARSDEMEELPEEEIHTLLSPIGRRWRVIRRLFARLLPRRRAPAALTAERRPSRPRWMWIGLASAGVGVVAFLLMSGKPATTVPVALTTVAPGPSVAQLPGPEERSIPKPAPAPKAAAPVAAAPAPKVAAPVAAAPAPREAPPPPAPTPAPRAAAPVEAAPPGSGECTADIDSTPRADVEVGGRSLGQTPLRGAAVPCGASALTISHPRYRRVTRTLSASPGAPAQVEERLVRPTAQLQLSPATANWKVNGRSLPAGTQSYDVSRFETVKLEARLSAKKTWRKQLYVKAAVTRLTAR